MIWSRAISFILFTARALFPARRCRRRIAR
jgi:hypothetical protein